MTTATNNTRTVTNAKANTSSSADRMTISMMGGASVLIGLWAVACMVSALVSTGPVGLVKGFFSAVTGM